MKTLQVVLFLRQPVEITSVQSNMAEDRIAAARCTHSDLFKRETSIKLSLLVGVSGPPSNTRFRQSAYLRHIQW